MSTSRKDFLIESGLIATGFMSGGFGLTGFSKQSHFSKKNMNNGELDVDLMIIGGGTGGCAAALSACKMGLKVIMTEETDWIGGQLTSQGVPPDEHPWIERFGSTRAGRRFRELVRQCYFTHCPMSYTARNSPALNPGSGWVGHFCHEPRVAL